MDFLASMLEAKRILQCRKSEYHASLYPGLFFLTSFDADRKPPKLLFLYSTVILLCELQGALYIPVMYLFTTQIMGVLGKGKLLL